MEMLVFLDLTMSEFLNHYIVVSFSGTLLTNQNEPFALPFSFVLERDQKIFIYCVTFNVRPGPGFFVSWY